MENNADNIKLADQILQPKDLKGTYVDPKRGTFTYQLPTPRQRTFIEQNIATTVGAPIEQFNNAEYISIRKRVYVDSILTSSPDWWVSADDCMDEDLVDKIFTSFWKDYEAFRGKLREGKFTGTSKA